VRKVYVRKVDTVTDTAYVFNDYFNYRWYARSFGDTNFQANARIGVWQNKIDSFQLDYELKNRTKTVTNTVTKQKTYNYKVWLGASTNFDAVNIDAALDIGKHQFEIGRALNKKRWRVGYKGVIFSR